MFLFDLRGRSKVTRTRNINKTNCELGCQSWLLVSNKRSDNTDLVTPIWQCRTGNTRTGNTRTGNTELATQSWQHKNWQHKNWQNRIGNTDLATQNWRQNWQHRTGNTDLATQKCQHGSGNTELATQKCQHGSGNTELATQNCQHGSGNTELSAQNCQHRTGNPAVELADAAVMSSVCPPRSSVLLAALGLALCRLSAALEAADIPPIAGFFGTKTRYEEVNPRLLRDARAADPSVLRTPPSERCFPVHLTAVVRHGSRYPTLKNIRRIRRLSELVRGEAGAGRRGAPQEAPGWLRDIRDTWEMWLTDDMDGQLVMKGEEDVRFLALRLSSLFPSLFSGERLSRVRLRSSSTPRCVRSSQAFLQGLGGQTEVQVDDGLLRFFERCRGYVEAVEKNRTALQEVERFKHGGEMKEVRRKISEKLQIHEDQITPDLVQAAFFLCSYELSVLWRGSPWCFLFDQEDAKVLEYLCDLKQFWKRSHGHVISGLSSCPLFQDIFRTLDRAGRPRRSTEEPAEPASILVGHAETLLPLLSLLGLHRDQTPPTAANYNTQHGRVFRTSLIAPYAANLVFVLFDCERGPRLQLLLNEAPLRFPGLPDEAPLYRDVRANYRHLLDSCDTNRECEGGRGGRGGRGPNTEL